MMDFYTIEPCATSNAFEIKFTRQVKIDLDKAEKALGKSGEVIAKTTVVLVLKLGDRSASVYASGRIMLKDVTKEEADKLAKKLASAMEKGGAFV